MCQITASPLVVYRHRRRLCVMLCHTITREQPMTMLLPTAPVWSVMWAEVPA